MATYTSAFTGSEIDTILASVGTIADTQSNLDTDCDTIITKLNNMLAMQTNIFNALSTINTTLDPDPAEIIYNASVAADTTISDITPIDTSLIKKLWIFYDQTASQSLTISMKAMSSTSATTSSVIEPITLGTTTLSASRYWIDLPPAITFEIKNNDAVNATNVTITIVKTR